MCFQDKTPQNPASNFVEFRRETKKTSRNQLFRRISSIFFLVFLVNFDIFWYILVDIDRNRFRCGNKTKKRSKTNLSVYPHIGAESSNFLRTLGNSMKGAGAFPPSLLLLLIYTHAAVCVVVVLLVENLKVKL